MHLVIRHALEKRQQVITNLINFNNDLVMVLRDSDQIFKCQDEIKELQAEYGVIYDFLHENQMPRDERMKAIDKVSSHYEATKETISNLLSDLTPSPVCQSPVNPRIEKLYQQISTLRDLACIVH